MYISRNLMISVAFHLLVISAVFGANGIGVSVFTSKNIMTVFLLSQPEELIGQEKRNVPPAIGRNILPAPKPVTETILHLNNTAAPEIAGVPADSPAPPVKAVRETLSIVPIQAAESSGRGMTDSPFNAGEKGVADMYSSKGGAAATRDGRQGRASSYVSADPAANYKNADSIGAIRRAIDKAKHYPAIAKKRGVEGTAFIEFTINGMGHPENVRIVRSSGSDTLDAAALQTIAAAAPFPLVTGILELPIAYRLEK